MAIWERYATHKKWLHQKNNGDKNAMELFHGTRGNDPKLVYEGEVGFDFRFGSGSKCKWGQANYFAVNARYSRKFAHCTSDGSKELILARVLTGYSYECQPD